MSERANVDATVAEAIARCGSVDILVNNAGVFDQIGSTLRFEPAAWDHDVQVNLSGPFYATRAVLPGMLERRWGRIINISSMSSRGVYKQPSYGATKEGLIGLTKTVALEFAAGGITANAVLPGLIATAKALAAPEDIMRAALRVDSRGSPRDPRGGRRPRGLSRVGRGRVHQRRGHHGRRRHDVAATEVRAEVVAAVTAQPKWFAHANVNCSELDASERFYVECLDLMPRWRTEPSHVQDGAGFGMPGAPVQWEGAILTDRRGLRGPAVDLLRWIAPATEGAPYAPLSHLGFRALQFTVEDLERISACLDAAGLVVNRRTYRDDHGRVQAVVTTRDPGETAIELVGGAAATTYAGVRVNCSDLDRSVDWYRNALGLAAAPNRVVDVLDADDAVVGRFRAADVFVPHHPRSFRLELTEWIDPQPAGCAVRGREPRRGVPRRAHRRRHRRRARRPSSRAARTRPRP